MKFEEFKEISVESVRAKLERSSLKKLIRNTGEFYYYLFSWGPSYQDFKEKISLLVDHGLDLNQPICEHWRDKKAPIFQLLEYPDGTTATAIKALVECGADINLQNDVGQTPVMVASGGRYDGDLSKPSVVKALIKGGADLSLKDKKGNLVTDLADKKALPVLVAAGAPVRKNSRHALMTAVWARDLALTQELLSRGLKKSLQDRELLQNLAFLETVEQTCPELFRDGFSLEDSERRPADKKAVSAFKKLVGTPNPVPMSAVVSEGDENALPPVLRLGHWPPRKSDPTPHIDVHRLPAPRPEFRFPSDLKQKFDELWNVENESCDQMDVSRLMQVLDERLSFIQNADWDTIAEGFTKKKYYKYYKSILEKADKNRIILCLNYISNHFSDAEKTFSIFNIYDKEKFELEANSKSFKKYLNNKFNIYADLNYDMDFFGMINFRIYYGSENGKRNIELERYASDLYINQRYLMNIVQAPWVSSYKERLSSDYVDYYIHQFNKNYLKKTIDYYKLIDRDVGEWASPFMLERAKQGDLVALRCLSYFDDASLAAFMANNLTIASKSRYAMSWLSNFPDTSIRGLLACSFGSDLAERTSAQDALRLLARNGYKQHIIDCASAFGDAARLAAVDFLDRNPVADFLPKKLPKLPTYFVASAHPAPILKSSGEALPLQAVETLSQMMLVSSCHLQTHALHEVIEACDGKSLADFALSVFEVWAKNGAKKDGIGFLYALAYLGDDRAVAMLSKSYRHAPPTAVSPVLDVLASIGTNAAIAEIQAIARSSQKEESRQIAQLILEDVARDRGMTSEMLEDLAVPDLGLDENGQTSFNFGPRQFVATIAPNLEAILTDMDCNVQKNLPKPVKSDNAQMAKLASAQWKEFKAALKGQAADQKKRFEQAMLIRREWDGATFTEIVASHPLLAPMVRCLVWATVKDGVPNTFFRIDASGCYLDADGAELSVVDGERITLPHPLLLEDQVETWVQVFAENKLTQPFPQLARKWFIKGSETEKLISDRDGTKVPLGSLRGLKAKGWDFEEGGAGMIWSVYKSTDGARASIDIEPGWSISGYDYEDFGGDQTVKLDVSGNDPIAYSELVREFLSLPIVES